MITIDSEEKLIKQVKKTIALKHLLKKGDRVIVGLSGGPDSLCLSHVLLSLSSTLGINMFFGHLNHGFRRESSAEFSYVRFLAWQWGIPFFGATIDVPYYAQKWGWSAQKAARYFRYRFLLKAACHFQANKIALGHHRDDQIETVLMNIIHGAGTGGLAGMEISREWKGTTIIRPLLNNTKAQIWKYCQAKGLEPVEDASNLKDIYRRNKVRLELIPYLQKEYNPRIDDAIIRISGLAREDDHYLERKANYFLQLFTFSRDSHSLVLDASKLAQVHISLQRRVLRGAWRKIYEGEDMPDFGHIESIMQLYQKGKTGSAISLPHQVIAYNIYGGRLVFARTGKKHTVFKDILLNIPGLTLVPGTRKVIKAEIKPPHDLNWPPDKRKEAYLDLKKMILPLKLQNRWAGARFHPLGLEGKSKKLKDYFIDQKIPRQERDFYPLLVSGDDIVWVLGLDISHHFRITEETRCALVLKYIFRSRPLSSEEE